MAGLGVQSSQLGGDALNIRLSFTARHTRGVRVQVTVTSIHRFDDTTPSSMLGLFLTIPFAWAVCSVRGRGILQQWHWMRQVQVFTKDSGCSCAVHPGAVPSWLPVVVEYPPAGKALKNPLFSQDGPGALPGMPAKQQSGLASFSGGVGLATFSASRAEPKCVIVNAMHAAHMQARRPCMQAGPVR